VDIIEAIRSRTSIRMFKPDPVPQEVLREILEIAARAPSSMNTQPWEITVVSGDVLDKIKQGNLEKLASGAAPERDTASRPYEGVYRQRQVDLAIQIFQLMGIAREDREKRTQWMQRGFRFFDAPAAIILSADDSLGDSSVQFDLGSISQTICLAALNYGLGTCIEGQGVTYASVLREFTGIPEAKRIIMCIAIGYPDRDFPANRLETTREPVAGFTTWCGF